MSLCTINLIWPWIRSNFKLSLLLKLSLISKGDQLLTSKQVAKIKLNIQHHNHGSFFQEIYRAFPNLNWDFKNNPTGWADGECKVNLSPKSLKMILLLWEIPPVKLREREGGGQLFNLCPAFFMLSLLKLDYNLHNFIMKGTFCQQKRQNIISFLCGMWFKSCAGRKGRVGTMVN